MYLPTEILKDIGSYLSTSDKGRCMSVCYAWYTAFLELLYTNIHIQSRHQFRLFYRTIQRSVDIDDPLGDNVKELSFAYHSSSNEGYSDKDKHPVGISQAELDTFPTYFKYLERLDFAPQLWKYYRYSDVYSKLKYIKRFPTFNRKVIFQPILNNLSSQLTYLSISGEATEYLIANNLTTSVWNKMPKLEELILKGTNHTHLNVKMLMALGAQLSHLKHVTFSCVSLPLNEQDLNSTTSLPLFTAAESLILDDVHIPDWKMITFLNLAFYHIHTLDLDVRFDWFYNDNVTIELFEQSMDACMGFAQLCMFLTKVKFRKISTSVFPFPYDAFFQQLAAIHGNNVQVEMTDYAWWSTIDPISTFKIATSKTGLLSKADLLWSWTGKKSDLSLFKAFSHCTHLTQLELFCDIPLKNGLRIDLLLDNCSQLKILRIANSLVTTQQPLETAKDKHYKLMQLNLTHAILGDQLMDYIAKSCPSLDHLCIADCSQEKPKKSAFIIIRMPEHTFKLIKLNSLYLNPGGVHRGEVDTAILSFYESSRYNRQHERLKLRQDEHHKAAAEMWRFYHVNTLSNNHTKQLRRLSTEEAAVVANFEMTDKKWKAVRSAPKRVAYQTKENWEKDIPFGAILLLCMSVERLEFNEIVV